MSPQSDKMTKDQSTTTLGFPPESAIQMTVLRSDEMGIAAGCAGHRLAVARRCVTTDYVRANAAACSESRRAERHLRTPREDSETFSRTSSHRRHAKNLMITGGEPVIRGFSFVLTVSEEAQIQKEEAVKTSDAMQCCDCDTQRGSGPAI